MCIIAAKNKGVSFPSIDTVENMWYNNSDGAGLMWREGNKVCISKGYMNLKSFKRAISELEDRLDLTETPMVMHFRIGTHGGNIPSNTHPFPIMESVSALQKLDFKTNIGVAHNGIIPIDPRSKNISDTMEYIAAQLYPIKCIKPTFYKDKNCQKLIYNAIQSKMAFLNYDGKIYTIGDFITEEDGMIYSNTSYKPKTYYQRWDYSNWEYSDYLSGYNWPKKADDVKPFYKSLMWLDDRDGWVVDEEGVMYDGDWIYLFDKELDVYKYDYNTDDVIKLSKYHLVSANGNLEFDEEKAEVIYVGQVI